MRLCQRLASAAVTAERQLVEYRSLMRAGGGPKAAKRHTTQNKKLLVTDRLRLLLDDADSFQTLGHLAGLNMPYGTVPSAGIITGIGQISGRRCFIVANDATVKGGTVFPISVKKQLRAQEIAEENGLPCVYLVDSGGAFLPLQADIFPDKLHGGRVFYNQARMTVPQLSIVLGSCTAGGAYLPMMADESIIVSQLGAIFLGGPPLVFAALGEHVSQEDLGGAAMHSGISGCTDYFAATEEEAFAQARVCIQHLGERYPRLTADEGGFLHTKRCMVEVAAAAVSSQPDPAMMVDALADSGSDVQIFKQRFGSDVVCAFVTIRGILTGVVANSNSISSSAFTKSTHFVSICSERNIPLLFLHNTKFGQIPQDDVNLMKRVGQLIAAVSTCRSPIISLVTGHSESPFAPAFASSDMAPRFALAWPTATFDLHGTKATAFEAAGNIWLDEVITPGETRNYVAELLSIVAAKVPSVQDTQTQQVMLKF